MGKCELSLNGSQGDFKRGDVITIEPGTRHAFTTSTGCIIEEVSSTHYKDDSFYTDQKIHDNKNRKTFITHWMD